MRQHHPTIGISGLIGAGKTTLARGLADCGGGTALVEGVDENPYFQRFYADPSSYAFRHFSFFVEHSATDQHAASTAGQPTFLERPPLEHLRVFGNEFFQRGYFDRDDWELLQRMTTRYVDLLPPLDLWLHIEIQPEEAYRRMESRRRPGEEGIELEYLQSLHAKYPVLLDEVAKATTVVSLDAAEYDFRTASDTKSVLALASGVLDEEDVQDGDSVAGQAWGGKRHIGP